MFYNETKNFFKDCFFVWMLICKFDFHLWDLSFRPYHSTNIINSYKSTCRTRHIFYPFVFGKVSFQRKLHWVDVIDASDTRFYTAKTNGVWQESKNAFGTKTFIWSCFSCEIKLVRFKYHLIIELELCS